MKVLAFDTWQPPESLGTVEAACEIANHRSNIDRQQDMHFNNLFAEVRNMEDGRTRYIWRGLNAFDAQRIAVLLQTKGLRCLVHEG